MMRKIWMKVRLSGKSAEWLIRAFFENFNPNSSISVREGMAKMEIVFADEPPKKFIEAAVIHEVLEFNYGSDLTNREYGELQEAVEEETAEEAEEPQEAVEEETAEEAEEPQEAVEEETAEEEEEPQKEVVEEEIAEEEEPQKAVEEETAEEEEEPQEAVEEETAEEEEEPQEEVTKTKPVTIPFVDKVAKDAGSFDEFVERLSERLALGKRKDLFKELAFASTKVEVGWKNLENVLKERHFPFVPGDKNFISNQVSLLSNHSTTLIPLLKAVKEYKDYFDSFTITGTVELEPEVAEKETVAEEIPQEATEEEVNEPILEPRIKMEFMPEIAEFEETLGSVDKTLPIEDRVRYVMNSMGLKRQIVKDREPLIEMACKIIQAPSTYLELDYIQKMKLSTFINDFVHKYYPNKMVRVFAFLSDLRKVIMTEEELGK